jgi:hypothetical protein
MALNPSPTLCLPHPLVPSLGASFGQERLPWSVRHLCGRMLTIPCSGGDSFTMAPSSSPRHLRLVFHWHQLPRFLPFPYLQPKFRMCNMTPDELYSELTELGKTSVSGYVVQPVLGTVIPGERGTGQEGVSIQNAPGGLVGTLTA